MKEHLCWHMKEIILKSLLRQRVQLPKRVVEAGKVCEVFHSGQVIGKFIPPKSIKRTEGPTGHWQNVAVDIMGSMPV